MCQGVCGERIRPDPARQTARPAFCYDYCALQSRALAICHLNAFPGKDTAAAAARLAPNIKGETNQSGGSAGVNPLRHRRYWNTFKLKVHFQGFSTRTAWKAPFIPPSVNTTVFTNKLKSNLVSCLDGQTDRQADRQEGAAPDIRPSDHLDLFLICRRYETTSSDIINCLSSLLFSQHNASPSLPWRVQRDPPNPRCNLHDWQDVLLSFVRNQAAEEGKKKV